MRQPVYYDFADPITQGARLAHPPLGDLNFVSGAGLSAHAPCYKVPTSFSAEDVPESKERGSRQSTFSRE